MVLAQILECLEDGLPVHLQRLAADVDPLGFLPPQQQHELRYQYRKQLDVATKASPTKLRGHGLEEGC